MSCCLVVGVSAPGDRGSIGGDGDGDANGDDVNDDDANDDDDDDEGDGDDADTKGGGGQTASASSGDCSAAEWPCGRILRGSACHKRHRFVAPGSGVGVGGRN